MQPMLTREFMLREEPPASMSACTTGAVSEDTELKASQAAVVHLPATWRLSFTPNGTPKKGPLDDGAMLSS